MPFTVEPSAIPEVLLVRVRRHADDRGWFQEVLRADAFAELGLPASFVQVNHSHSRRGVVRGLHFQWDPPQGKLMRVVAGRAYLVAVDIRPGSPTLGHHVALEASADDPILVWAPASFARGFMALEDGTEIEYFCTAVYNPAAEGGIRWNDPSLAIAWPFTEPTASAKDAAAGSLADWLARPEAASFAV
jgi:dTDP-4-dehydrorhamnose 3,5-epimerase